MIIAKLWAPLVVAAVLTACQGSTDARPTTSVDVTAVTADRVEPTHSSELNHPELIAPEELAHWLKSKDFFLVNTHVPYEGEIAQTDAFIPYNEIEKNLARLPADKHAPIVVYCRSGRMSAIAANTLQDLGYANVWDLEGGMIAWEKAGFTVERK